MTQLVCLLLLQLDPRDCPTRRGRCQTAHLLKQVCILLLQLLHLLLQLGGVGLLTLARPGSALPVLHLHQLVRLFSSRVEEEGKCWGEVLGALICCFFSTADAKGQRSSGIGLHKVGSLLMGSAAQDDNGRHRATAGASE